MTKAKKISVLVVLGVVMALALALVGCAGGSATKAKTLEDGKLKVISSLDFPPFENLEGNEAVGFEIELIQALGDKMGLEVEIENQAFDTLVPAIAAGTTADVSISGITITDERAEEVNFSDPYMDSNQALVVMSDSGITDVKQLEGKKIAAQSGTTGSDWARENIPGAEVVDYQEATACFSALQAGKADAVSMDLPVSAYMITTGYPDATILQETPTGEQFGIIVNKDNEDLLKALNEALKEAKADGTYDKISQKWFGDAAVTTK